MFFELTRRWLNHAYANWYSLSFLNESIVLPILSLTVIVSTFYKWTCGNWLTLPGACKLELLFWSDTNVKICDLQVSKNSVNFATNAYM